MTISALVITLRRSSERAQQVRRIIDRCPVPCEIWDASDGAQMSNEQIATVYQPRLHTPYYPFQLRPGEIGCFMSHRRIWQKMVDESISRLLILEDDIEMLPNFEHALKHASETAPRDGYVQFQVRNLYSQSKSNEIVQSPEERKFTLIKPTVAPLRTSAQLVTLGAAQRLLHYTQIFDRPIDAAIQLTWRHGATMFVSHPQSVIEISNSIGGSTIGGRKKRKPLIENLRREIDRAIYRRRIVSAAKRYAA